MALIYIALAMPVTLRAGIVLHGMQGSYAAELGACGVFVRLDGLIDLKRRMLTPRQGRERRLSGRRNSRPRLLRLASVVRFEAMTVHVRAGLGDAAQTALAAGAMRAALSAVMGRIGKPAQVIIEPDYCAPGFALEARGIVSFCVGDIIHAAICAALKKKKREGFGWKSIPLRA